MTLQHIKRTLSAACTHFLFHFSCYLWWQREMDHLEMEKHSQTLRIYHYKRTSPGCGPGHPGGSPLNFTVHWFRGPACGSYQALMPLSRTHSGPDLHKLSDDPPSKLWLKNVNDFFHDAHNVACFFSRVDGWCLLLSILRRVRFIFALKCDYKKKNMLMLGYE